MRPDNVGQEFWQKAAFRQIELQLKEMARFGESAKEEALTPIRELAHEFGEAIRKKVKERQVKERSLRGGVDNPASLIDEIEQEAKMLRLEARNYEDRLSWLTKLQKEIEQM